MPEVCVLIDRRNERCPDTWVKFPWEKEQGPEDAVVRLLSFLGENPRRAGLLDTPRRVVKALSEMTAGYKQDAATYLRRTFPDRADEMVVVRGIRFTSLCEHHLMPFYGRASVGYVPRDEVVGLSKIPRAFQVFAQRLQVQERLTEEVAEAIETSLNPKGVGVVVIARHECMACRGARQPDAEMVTSALRGAMKDDVRARAEFLRLAGITQG